MPDVLECQFSLLPERPNQVGTSLHGLQAPTREVADLCDRRRAQIGDFVLLQVAPDRLDRVEFRGIRGKKGDRDAPALVFEPAANEAALVRAHTVPDDQEL